jgi:CMP-N,N'-diacetyllegionaminic acid synthase
MRVLAIIPARKGSKGIKNKNIQMVNGHPLIAYSISAAVQSKKVNRIICSTDSKKIATIARKYGAETPFIRPNKYAKDLSTDLEVFTHCLNWLKKNENYTPNLVVHLRPTSPVRFLKDIDKGLRIMKKKINIDSIRSVSEPLTTPYKMWKKKSDGNLEPILTLKNNKEPYNTARQLLPKIFAQTGTLDIVRIGTILKKKSMTGDTIYPLFINIDHYVDIDTIRSLRIAENLIKTSNCIKP